MERMEAIKALAMYHAARGIYDNSACRTGMERVAYAKAWANIDSRPAYIFNA